METLQINMNCKMNGKTLFFGIICLLLISANSQASAIKRMYEVSLPVVSQERQIRRAAFEQALIEVSVRVSGTSLAPTQMNLNRATSLVSQYRYQSMGQQEIDAYMKQTKTLVAPKYKLWIQFEEGKIKQLLRDNSLPIWGYQRPNVLVWLAVKDGKNRYLLKKSDRSLIKDAVIRESRKRGLPIVWPEIDAQDQKQVSFIDVWGKFWEPVKQASKRYPVDAIILGQMNWDNGSWQVDWSLSLEDKTDSWQLTAVDLDLLMSSGIGVATDHVSSRFAVFADSANDGELLVRVSDLNSVKKYAAASHYLSSLAPVKHVFATEVNQHYIDFYIELSGDESDLKRIIALGKVLKPDTRPEIEINKQASTGSVTATGNQTTGAPANAGNSNSLPPGGISTETLPAPGIQKQQRVLRYRMNG